MDVARRIAAAALVMAALGCSSSSSPAIADDPCAGEEGRRVVTADWLERSLTILSHDRLVAGCPAETAIVAQIDLSAYDPGPLQIEIAPDGRTAVVSLTAGFFEGAGGALVGSPEVPPGGGLLIVDLDAAEVRASLDLPQVPMGIAIHPDGTRAFTANFGREGAPGDSLSVIDLTTDQVVDTIAVGALPEQVSLSEDGALGIINLAGEDAVRVFRTDDPAGSLSAPVPTGGDPSDVVIVGERALVTNSAGFSYGVIDVSDPAAPVALETVQLPATVPYGASQVPGTRTVLVAAFLVGTTLYPIDLANAPTEVGEGYALEGGAFPLGVAIDPEGTHAFVAHPVDHQLSVVDLESGEVQAVSWLTELGPTYVAVAP